MLGLPRSPAAWFIQGTAVHKAVESWENSWRSAVPARIVNIFDEVWDQEERAAWEREPDADAWMRSGMKKTKTDLSDRRVRGRDQVLTYIEATQKENLRTWIRPDTGQPATEVEFEEDFGGVRVKGYIDLVMEDVSTGALLVRDVKTGTKKPVGTFQLATYRFALKKKFGVDALWGDYWMCKDGEPSPPEYLGEIPEKLIVSQYQQMDEAESSEDYGANVGDHCNRCDVARHCPMIGGTPPEGIPMLGT